MHRHWQVANPLHFDTIRSTPEYELGGRFPFQSIDQKDDRDVLLHLTKDIQYLCFLPIRAGCSATTRSKGSRRSRSANCSGVTTTSALRTNRAFLSSDKQCSTSARKRWTNRMRTRLRLSPIRSSDEAGVPSSMSGFSLQRLQKRLEMPGGGGSFPRQTAPPAVMVTSKVGYELHRLTSVQFCTPSTSPVLDKTHSRPVPI